MNAHTQSNQPDPRQPSDDTNTSQKGKNSINRLGLLPTPIELATLLSKRVIGQEEAKRSIAVAVYQHLINCASCDTHGGRVETENHLMLVGPSGSGKSLLLRTLGDILPIPLFYISCTNIVPNGYKGKDFTQHLDAISTVITDEKFTHPAIVVWDDADTRSATGYYHPAIRVGGEWTICSGAVETWMMRARARELMRCETKLLFPD